MSTPTIIATPQGRTRAHGPRPHVGEEPRRRLTAAAGITHGAVFRAINKAARVWGDGMSPKVPWDVARTAAARARIDELGPHDLRRTCARLCHLGGGELDQIQFLLGPVSIPNRALKSALIDYPGPFLTRRVRSNLWP